MLCAMTPNAINTRMGLSEWSALILLSMLWGGSYFFVEIALEEWSPLLIVGVRVCIASIVIWTFVLLSGLPVPREASAWMAFFWMAILNNILPFLLIVWGQTEVTAGLAAILNASTPIFAVIVAGLLLKDEPMTRPRLAGAVLGLIGVAILIGPGALSGIDANLLAQLAILAAGLSYTFAGVYGRRFTAMGIHPVVAASGQLLLSSLVMITLVLAFDTPGKLLTGSLTVWGSVLAMAVFSTALAYMLYFRLIATAGATNALLVTLLIPVTAVMLGFLILDERLHVSHFIGMCVIALALSVIDGRLWSRRKPAGRS